MVENEPCFGLSASPVSSCIAVPCKTLDGKVAGVILATNSLSGVGFRCPPPSPPVRDSLDGGH